MKKYEMPTVEVIKLQIEDVVTTSTDVPGDIGAEGGHGPWQN